MSQKSDFTFFHRLRVRWAEVDLQRVVFNGNYLLYFDVAFTEYWRATGLRDPLAQQAEGKELFVRKASLEYHGSAGFDDELDIGVRCAKLGRSSMTIAIAIFRGDEHLVDGEVIYVYADTHVKKSAAIPDAWRERIAALEVKAPNAP
jgi:acyl-CoA thioester hydrolase